MINSDTEDQILKIKHWFRKYGKLTAVVIILVVVSLGIRQYWHWYHQTTLDRARESFTDLVTHLDTKDEKSIHSLVQFANQENNSYGVFAALKVAQFYAMDRKEYSKAENILSTALTKTKEDELRDIVLLRIARLQLQQRQFAKSITTLNEIKGKSWMPLAARVRGDVYLKQQKYQESITAYQEALDAEQNAESRKMIEIKLNQAEFLLKKMEHPLPAK